MGSCRCGNHLIVTINPQIEITSADIYTTSRASSLQGKCRFYNLGMPFSMHAKI